MQAQDDLLVLFFDGNKAHVRSGDGLADGGGIRCIVFATFAAHAVGRDELRCHQFDGVTVLPKQARPVVCARAGFHADETGR